MGCPLYVLGAALLASSVLADNSTVSDTCDLDSWTAGPWSQALEEWATAPVYNERQGRIMALPSSPGYYVTDRVDRPPAASLPVPHPYTEWGDSASPHRGPGQWAGPAEPQSHPQHGHWSEELPPMGPQQQTSGTPGPSANSGHHMLQNTQWNDGAGSIPAPPMHMNSQAPPPVPLQHESTEWPTASQHPNNAHYEYKDPAGSKGTKIVNRPPNKDQFKPSPEYQPQQHPSKPQQYPPKPQQYPTKPQQYPTKPQQYPPKPQQYPPKPQQYPVPPGPVRPPVRPTPSRPNTVDRVDDPPKRPVSETDLYLLSAIEKLAYRADLFEKRLRRLEDSVHRLVANKDPAPEPCVTNFTRVGGVCYHFSGDAMDWKEASLYCRRMKASLLELESERERNTMVSAMLTDKKIRGMDVWTGGLNPGLLWIWSHSARPVAANSSNSSVSIQGEGRCLALVHDPAINNYVYRGQDCAFRHRFVCEREEDRARLTNEIDKVARSLELLKGSRQARRFDGNHDDANR